MKTSVVVVFLVFCCFNPGLSWGHTFPDHSDPEAGSTLSYCPSVVRIWFDSDLEPDRSNLMVHSLNGGMVDKRDSRVDPSDPKLLEVSIPHLAPGTYTVIWWAVSKGTEHRTQGRFQFTIK